MVLDEIETAEGDDGKLHIYIFMVFIITVYCIMEYFIALHSMSYHTHNALFDYKNVTELAVFKVGGTCGLLFIKNNKLCKILHTFIKQCSFHMYLNMICMVNLIYVSLFLPISPTPPPPSLSLSLSPHLSLALSLSYVNHSIDAEEGEQISNATLKMLMDAYINSLPHCVNRDHIDKVRYQLSLSTYTFSLVFFAYCGSESVTDVYINPET